MTRPLYKRPLKKNGLCATHYLPQDKRPEEERHCAIGRDATFSWSRALTYHPRCYRTGHREVWGLMVAILDRLCDVIEAKEGPVLLQLSKAMTDRIGMLSQLDL